MSQFYRKSRNSVVSHGDVAEKKVTVRLAVTLVFMVLVLATALIPAFAFTIVTRVLPYNIKIIKYFSVQF